jgi:transglutaminase-like putative cysteine protease
MSLRSLFSASFALFLLLCGGCSSPVDDLYASYNKQFRSYDARIKKDPADSDLKIEFAKFCYTFKDYEKIKELLRSEESFEAKLLLAKAYTHRKDYDYAIETFEQIKDSLTEAEAFYLYARVLEAKNLYPRAIEAYRVVGAPYKERAQERLRAIKTKVETEIPPRISRLTNEASRFLEEISDEAAVILSVEEEMEITQENTSISTLYVVQQVLSERGKSLAEVELGYDSTYERVHLEYARTITQEGKMIYAGEENIRDVTKYLNFPLYSNAKAFIISMPSVDVGAIIEYKLKIYSSKLVNEDDFSILYRLRERHPIYKASFALRVPKKQAAKYKFFNQAYSNNIDLHPQVKEEGATTLYSWHFKNIKPIIPEENMPPYSHINPAILISSFDSWGEIYSWWHTLYKDKLNLGPETKRFVKELIQGAASVDEKAKKIYEFCAKNIRYVAVEYGESGYEPHQAEEVYFNRYGDCKDQAMLLVAMLREAGIDAYPVLIPTREAYAVEEDFPSLNFNHAIAVVKLNDNFIFMDPTSNTTSFKDLPLSDQERNVLICLDDDYKIVKTPLRENNRIFYTMEIAIDEEENASIKRNVKTQGAYSSYQRWYLKYTHPATIKEDIENKVVRISPFSKLIEYKIEDVDNFDVSPTLEYLFSTEKFLNPAKDLRIVPVLNEIEINHSLIAKEQREFPIDFSGLFTKVAQISITLPSSLQILYLPDDVDVSTDWFDFTLSYKIEEGVLNFSQRFLIKKRFVQIEEYNEFREALKNICYLLREEAILKKIH